MTLETPDQDLPPAAKRALVTASTSGIGKSLCLLLAARGYDLVLLNRDKARTEAQLHDLRRQFSDRVFASDIVDFADRQALTAAAGRIAAKFPVIDAVFLNAGVLLAGAEVSPQGNEMHFEVNTLAPFALVHLLWKTLAAANGAVICVSGSGARRMASRLKVSELDRPGRRTGMMGRYAQSKQAIAAACAALRPELALDNISIACVDLPPTRTAMAKSPGLPLPFRLFSFLFARPEAAAQRLLARLDDKEEGRTVADRSLPDAQTTRSLTTYLYQKAGIDEPA